MTFGFDQFDGAHRENFAAALILLCIEEDPSFRSAFVNLIRTRAALPPDAVLLEWGRERCLDVEAGAQRRSDLWLRFSDGFVLVEVKTHSNWPPFAVSAQLAAQAGASFADTKELVTAAVLLAPGALIHASRAAGDRVLSWHDLLSEVDRIDHPSQLLRLAYAHWSRNVEPDFGLPESAETVSVEQTVARVMRRGAPSSRHRQARRQ